jgi:transposase
MIQLAWRFTRFQPDSPLTQWFKSRTSDGRKDNRKRMIVALARKLLIAVWRLAEHGVVPEGIVMRAAA